MVLNVHSRNITIEVAKNALKKELHFVRSSVCVVIRPISTRRGKVAVELQELQRRRGLRDEYRMNEHGRRQQRLS
jgi:hypothetical protein